MVLHFNMQGEDIFEHAKGKCHVCTLQLICRPLCNIVIGVIPHNYYVDTIITYVDTIMVSFHIIGVIGITTNNIIISIIISISIIIRGHYYFEYTYNTWTI